MSHARDPVREIIAFNAPLVARGRSVRGVDGLDLTAEAVRRKLEVLAGSPFAFFRGTFHLMAHDVLRERVPLATARAPEALIVGDVHLENFGVYRGASGKLVFDVNDFDDVALGPADFDVKRLCTSAHLLPGAPAATRAKTARAIADAWARTVERLGGRFPVAAWTEDRAEGPVLALLRDKHRARQRGSRGKEGLASPRRGSGFGGSTRKQARIGRAWTRVVLRAVTEYEESLEKLKAELPGSGWRPLDVVYRFKGAGSLGRLRFFVLLGRGRATRVLEIKEARPSCLDEAQGRPSGSERARAQTAAIRRLQGDPWPQVAGTHLGRLQALGREIQPEEEKVSVGPFAAGSGKASRARLLSYARQCGEVLARLHCRVSAPTLLDWDFSPRAAADAAVAFARRYASQVEDDHAAFVAARDRIARALGL